LRRLQFGKSLIDRQLQIKMQRAGSFRVMFAKLGSSLLVLIPQDVLCSPHGANGCLQMPMYLGSLLLIHHRPTPLRCPYFFE
jgi:hypothetical protein